MGSSLFNGLHEKVRSVADSYARKSGFELNHGKPQQKVDHDHGAKIAQAYEEMPHNPEHPDTKKAYDALVNETLNQYHHIRNSGVKFSKMHDGVEDPYKSSKDLLHDLHNNDHMWYYPTESGYGADDDSNKSDHPLLQTVDTNDGPMVANDLFRVVHDYFGHAKEGHQFGPSGEDAAWKSHMEMYSPEAQKALTSETRGQNSWVNFGPKGESNRKDPKNTVYAEQKAGLLPDWVMDKEPMSKSEKAGHPATDSGHHFIFSPEKPKATNNTGMSPDEVLRHVRDVMGEDVEDTHGKYGDLERSFIVHNPKNIDKLHNLSANLGQESAIISNGGGHEMHYYHGVHSGKVRHGSGTQVFGEAPEDNYTKISTPSGSKYFSHNFSWDDGEMITPEVNKAMVSNIYNSLTKNKVNMGKYWGMMLLKSSIRVEGRLFVAMDGDNIGASVQRAAMADDLDTIMSQSAKISDGQRFIREWASAHDADIYLDGGDDIAFTLPTNFVQDLESLKRIYFETTGYTITIGHGDTISHAGHAMLFGKLKGKNQVNGWSPEIEEELDEISQDLSPVEKLQDHGLLGKDEISGGLADKKKPSDFPIDKLREGVRVELEHTDDPKIAAEIAMDHLTEDINYYSKIKDLEKAMPPPMKVGEKSHDGRYVAQHHKPAGMVAWRYSDDLSNQYDSDIDNQKEAFIAKHPKEHQDVVRGFIDSVRGDYHRHFVIGKDQRHGGDKVRARHMRGLINGNDNYELNVTSPDSLTFTAHERHGNTPKSSNWSFDKKTSKVFDTNTDNGVEHGRQQYAKSEISIQNSSSRRHMPVGHDKKSIRRVFELVQFRKHYGFSGRSASLAKTSQDGRVNLVHYGTTGGLTELDPQHMGSGVGAGGAESKHGRPEVERTYFYREGTYEEPQVKAKANAKYTTSLEPHHKIYDIATDVDGIHDKVKESTMSQRSNRGIVTNDQYLAAVRDAGYHGYYHSGSGLPGAVALFHKHPVQEDKLFRKSEPFLSKSKNVREQRRKVFGTNANPARMSPKRRKAMEAVKTKAKDMTGLDMTIGHGKRHSSGELKEKDLPVNKQRFDIFSDEDVENEKEKLAEIKEINIERKKLGLKDIKRIDPKPDWRSGNLETQPSPDAAVHELAHLVLAPEGEGLADTQISMDKEWGESQSDFGHLQQKQTAGEIQPMAMENKLRRRMGLPANRSFENPEDISEHDRPVEEAVDGTGPRFIRGIRQGRDGPKSVDYVRQSRLLSPQNQARLDRIDSGELIYDKDQGWIEGVSVNSKINRRAREKMDNASDNYFTSKLLEIKAKEALNKSAKLRAEQLKRKYFGDGKTEQQKTDEKISNIKQKHKDNENLDRKNPLKTGIKAAAKINKEEVNEVLQKEPKVGSVRSFREAFGKKKNPAPAASGDSSTAPSLDYSKMGPTHKEPEHSLDYAKINEIKTKPAAAALDYSKFPAPEGDQPKHDIHSYLRSQSKKI